MVAGVKIHLTVLPITGATQQEGAWTGSSPYKLGLQLCLRGIDVLLVGMCHRGGINDEAMVQLGKLTKRGSLPFIAAAD